MTLAAGTRLGPYEILTPLGAGGMGEVYRARDTRLAREVAVKVLPEDVSSDPERLRRFEREARAVSALSHPNIVTIFEVSRVDSTSLIVMELVEGKTVRELAAGLRSPSARFSRSLLRLPRAWPRLTPPGSSIGTSSPRT